VIQPRAEFDHRCLLGRATKQAARHCNFVGSRPLWTRQRPLSISRRTKSASAAT